MEVEENQTLSSANRETLRKTASWINFFVVALYVICGLVVLALIMIMSESRRPPYMGETFLGIGFVVIGSDLNFRIIFNNMMVGYDVTIGRNDHSRTGTNSFG